MSVAQPGAQQHSSDPPTASSWAASHVVGATAIVAVASALATQNRTMTLLAIGLATALSVGVVAVAQAERCVLLLLVSKPLVDLTWRGELMTLGGQRINAQTLLALCPPLMAVAALMLAPRLLVHRPVVYLLLAAICIGAVVSPSGQAWNELLRMASGVCVYCVAGRSLEDSHRFDRLARLMLVTVSVPIALGFLQWLHVLPFEYWDWIGGVKRGRVSGTYPHPLGLVYFLVYTTPLALYLLGRTRGQGGRALLLGFIAASLAILLLTYHRTALVAILLQLFLWLLFKRRYRTILALAFGGTFLLGHYQQPVRVLFENLSRSMEVSVSSPDFLRGRGKNWVLFMSAWHDSHPTFQLIGQGRSHIVATIPGAGRYESSEPHNDFIRILSTHGLLGLGLYVGMLAGFLRDGIWLARRDDRHAKDIGALLSIAVLTIVLFSLTTEPMRYPTASWYLFALASAATMTRRSQELPKWSR